MTNRNSKTTPDGPQRTDSERQVTRRLYDPDDEPTLGTVIVYALADARNVSPTALKLPTLYDCVDVESLESTLFDDRGVDRHTGGTVTFQYAEYAVSVTSDGWVEVYDSSSADVGRP